MRVALRVCGPAVFCRHPLPFDDRDSNFRNKMCADSRGVCSDLRRPQHLSMDKDLTFEPNPVVLPMTASQPRLPLLFRDICCRRNYILTNHLRLDE